MALFLVIMILSLGLSKTLQVSGVECSKKCVQGRGCSKECNADFFKCSYDVLSRFEMLSCVRCKIQCNSCCNEISDEKEIEKKESKEINDKTSTELLRDLPMKMMLF